MESGIGCHKNEVNVGGPKTKVVTNTELVISSETNQTAKSLKGFTELERFLFDASQFSGERLHSSTDTFDAIIGRSIEYLGETKRPNDGKHKNFGAKEVGVAF